MSTEAELPARPHCPACAAFDRWAVVWAERRGGHVGPLEEPDASDDVDPDPAEQIGYAPAKFAVYVLGKTDLARARALACEDALPSAAAPR